MITVGKEVFLDTNIIIAHLRRKRDYTLQLKDHDCFISRVVYGELCAGAIKSSRPEKQLENLALFLEVIEVVETDAVCGKIYGELWADLASTGSMIPTNDIWIAATAMAYKLPLVTEDAHLRRVKGLEIVEW